MTREELEHIIRASGNITNQYEFVILGSQSILGAIPYPPAFFTMSAEADIYPLADPELADQIDGAIGEGSDFHDIHGIYALRERLPSPVRIAGRRHQDAGQLLFFRCAECCPRCTSWRWPAAMRGSKRKPRYRSSNRPASGVICRLARSSKGTSQCYFKYVSYILNVLSMHQFHRTTSETGFHDSNPHCGGPRLWRGIGALLLVSTLLYALPRTSFFGALLITGFLGGAIASHVRVGNDALVPVLAALALATIAWGGLWCRHSHLRALVRGRGDRRDEPQGNDSF